MRLSPGSVSVASSTLATTAVALLASLLILAPSAEAAFRGKNGVIAFVRPLGKGSGIYTVDPVTRKQTRLRRLFAAASPVWAPNGKSIALTDFAGVLVGNLDLMRVKVRRKRLVGKRLKLLTPRSRTASPVRTSIPAGIPAASESRS